jgi:hypothetical protein
MLDEDPALTAVLCKMMDWQKWVINERGEGAWVWMSSRQMSEQLLCLYKRQKVSECFAKLVELGYLEKQETSDPTKPAKWKIDVNAVAEAAAQYIDAAGFMKGESASEDDVSVSDNGQTRPNTDSTKSTNNDCLSTKHAREDEPTDTEPTDTQPKYSQEPVGWLMHFAAQQGYELAINQSQSVIMRLVQRGLSDEDEQDYLVDKLGQAIAQDRPPGKFAHYVGNRRDVEQWQGDTTDDDESETVYTDYSW